MRIESKHDEAEQEGSRLAVDDQYYVEAKGFDLLSREDEVRVGTRIQEGNKAYMSLVDRMRPCLVENLEHPKVEELLDAIRDAVPANFIELVQRSGEVQLSADALDEGKTIAALFHS